jgi:hypothetical protein
VPLITVNMARRSTRDPLGAPVDVEQLRAQLERLESKLHAAKMAYLNRTTLDGEEMTYERLVAVATEYIDASYALQKGRFGAIKVRLSIAKLLR